MAITLEGSWETLDNPNSSININAYAGATTELVIVQVFTKVGFGSRGGGSPTLGSLNFSLAGSYTPSGAPAQIEVWYLISSFNNVGISITVPNIGSFKSPISVVVTTWNVTLGNSIELECYDEGTGSSSTPNITVAPFQPESLVLGSLTSGNSIGLSSISPASGFVRIYGGDIVSLGGAFIIDSTYLVETVGTSKVLSWATGGGINLGNNPVIPYSISGVAFREVSTPTNIIFSHDYQFIGSIISVDGVVLNEIDEIDGVVNP